MLNDKLDATIVDIAEIDSTGQTFRYPFNNENKKHLVDQKIINCAILKIRFTELEKNLDDLIHLIDLLIDEYKLGTFTSKLSRAQIFNFAKLLPSYHEWSEISFKEVKEDLKLKYNLSNNDFSKIVNHIKNNYELSYRINIKKEMQFLNNEQVIDIVEFWINENPDIYKKDSINFIGSKELIEPISEYLSSYSKCEDFFKPKITIDFVSDLKALFYFSRDNYKYSELYIFLFNNYKQELKYSTALFDEFEHIFSKLNFLENLLRTLFFINQIELAEKIIQIYDLESIFDFIPQARLGKFFKHFELLDY